MGGTVAAANRPEGGAIFTVRLAFAPATLASLPVAPSAANVSSAALRVLVVDDNTAARELLAEALRDVGHVVEVAADGRSALAACAARPPEVVLLDLNLPDLDGLEVTRRLRTLAAPARSPRIVGCSAEVFAETRTAALAAGMDEFLAKPVSLALLAATVAARPDAPAPSSAADSGDIYAHLRAGDLADGTRRIFSAEWPLLRPQLARAVADADAATVARRIHYLRTSALLLGDHALADAGHALQHAAAAQDWPAAAARLAAFEALAEDALRRLPA